MAGAHIAKVSAGHAKRHPLGVVARGLEITGKVIDHLRHQARPVDRIDGADFVALFEGQIIGDGLHQVLAIVKHAAYGDVVDVVIEQAKHLRLLKRAHTSVRAGHKDANAFFAAHRIFRSASGIATGGATNIQRFAAPRQFVFKQIAQELHRHVFESQRRAVGQGLEVQALFQPLERHYRLAAKDF